MDQARVAGVGNLIADEVLWRASLSPERPAGITYTDRGPASPSPPAGRSPRDDGSGRFSYRGPHGAAPGRRSLPRDGRTAPAGHCRRAHDVVVPEASALARQIHSKSDALYGLGYSECSAVH